MTSSADIPGMAAWSPLFSFVHMRDEMENRAVLVGGACESVGVVASRRVVTPNGEVAAVLVLLMVATVSEDEVIEVMPLEEGETMVGALDKGRELERSVCDECSR